MFYRDRFEDSEAIKKLGQKSAKRVGRRFGSEKGKGSSSLPEEGARVKTTNRQRGKLGPDLVDGLRRVRAQLPKVLTQAGAQSEPLFCSTKNWKHRRTQQKVRAAENVKNT
ncbi:unnamed protein product [Linum trigynum]|uniref:Uncharacterized protein n=1 Tax=Linum trigynum TaxID=586398 RepID=A0AAV2DLF3_9ROSI